MKRIATLDVLRGFALTGIIFINIRQLIFTSPEQTALDWQIMQTAIILVLGCLLDWPGKVHYITLVMIAAAILIVQMIGSAWWLRKFRMGPAEYLWRLGTYGRKRMAQRQKAVTRAIQS